MYQRKVCSLWMAPAERSAHFPPPWVSVCSQAVPAAPVGTAGAAFRPFPRCLCPPRLRPPLPDLSCEHNNTAVIQTPQSQVKGQRQKIKQPVKRV